MIKSKSVECCANCLEPFNLSSMDSFDGDDGDHDLIKFKIGELPPPSSSSTTTSSSPSQRIETYRHIYIEGMTPNDDHDDYDPINYFPSQPSTTMKKSRKILIKDAVSAVYQLFYLDWFKNNEENETTELDENDDIGICEKCAKLVKIMYTAYDEFNRVRRKNSYFSQKIQKLDRIMQKLQTNFETTQRTTQFENNSQNNEERELFDDFIDGPIEEDEEQGGCEVISAAEQGEIDTQVSEKGDRLTVSEKDEAQNNLSSTSSMPLNCGPPWLILPRLTRSQLAKFRRKKRHSPNNGLTTTNDFLDVKKDLNDNDDDDKDYVPDPPKSKRKRIRVRVKPNKDRIKKCAVWKEYATILVEPGRDLTGGKFQCKICDRILSSPSGMKLHVHGHRGDKPFKCEYSNCTKSFMSNASLHIHTMVHTGEKVQCTICGKLFGTPGYLVTHVKVLHQNIKRFLCNECGQVFANATILRTHSKIHSDLRPYRCSVCGKAFKQNHLLTRHQTTHEEKKFLCPTCGAGFVRGDGLKKHVTKHHKEQCAGDT